MEDTNNYKFKCDFYYLHYDIADHKHGTIYRHYYNDNGNGNDKIEYINGCNENNIKTFNDDGKFRSEIDKLKGILEHSNTIDKISKINNDYLQKYHLNTDINEYFKYTSLGHLCDENNILKLIDIEMSEPIIDIGLLFTFIKTDKFNIDNTLIEYYENDPKEKINTHIQFQTYKNHIQYCINTPIDLESCVKTIIKTGGTLQIETEQKYITHNNIMFYYKNQSHSMMPIVIEYDNDKNKFYIVDGNHRVAYHIINQHEYIPAIIIFQNSIINNIIESSEPCAIPIIPMIIDKSCIKKKREETSISPSKSPSKKKLKSTRKTTRTTRSKSPSRKTRTSKK
jgi:hypothetical protein